MTNQAIPPQNPVPYSSYETTVQNSSAPPELTLVVQWGSGGDCRFTPDDMETISEAVDDAKPGEYKALFPLHGPFGALNLGIDGRTLWLYTHGGAFIVGELVEPSQFRAKPNAPTTVDISKLSLEHQAAIHTLLNRKK